MKILTIKTIQAKIVIFTGIPILVIMAVLVTLSAISSFQTASRSADQQAYSDAQYQAARIKAQIEVPLDMSRSLAQSLAATQSGGEGTALTRAQVNKMLYNVLTENPDFLGIWTVWESNAFDGKDAEYQNTDGNDQTGRFIPYWVRGENNAIHYEPVVDYDTLDFYQCPKKTGIECVIDPYIYQIQGRPMSLTTVSVPVISGGKFLGVVGIDMDIHDLQQWADEYSGFNNLAQMRVVSNHGTFAAVKGEAPTALDSIENNKVYEDISSVLPRIQNEETFHTDIDQNLSFFSPITFGSTTTPWALNVVIPNGIIYQEATRAMWSQILTGGIFAAIGLLAIWLLSLQFTRPIVRLTGVANQVVAGKLDLYADIQSSDEIGVLANAFNNMISQVRDMLEKERSQRQYLEETVQKYVAYLNDVARGNLMRRVQINGNGHSEQDPLVQLGHNLNDMTASLQKMIGQIREASSNLSTASTEIMAATTQQASGTSEQSASIAQTTTTVDEVKVIAEQSRTRAHEVTRTAQRTVEVAHVGQQAVHDTINSMNEIRGRVEGIAENILSLSEQTQMIGEIIATVNEIASQSNMLALNASVEAARAGEHGKGFSVVAMEVRALAEQSKAATAQIKEILSEIQKATNATVMATEEGTKGVDRGVLMAVKAQEAIEQLAQVINETSQASTQMSAGAQQQMSGVEQVAMAMQNINQATIQNLASTRQAEKAAQNLNELARLLNEMVTLYQI